MMKRQIQKKKGHKTGLIALLVVTAGLYLSGCEDDPILQPNQSGADNEGSYGRIDLIPQDSNRIDKPARLLLMSNPSTNPDIF